MELSNSQKILLANLLGKARDDNPHDCEKKLKHLADEATDASRRLPHSGLAYSKLQEYNIECEKLFLNKCKDIYLDVLAPGDTTIDEALFDFIMIELKPYFMNSTKKLKEQLEPLRQSKTQDAYIADTIFKIENSIRRDIIIEKSRRETFKEQKEAPPAIKKVSPPSFDFIEIAELRPMLQRDYVEINKCLETECWKAAIILCGSAMEGILYDLLIQHEDEAINAAKGMDKPPIDKTTKEILAISEWNLSTLINVAYSLNLIEKGVKELSHTVKEYRNLVHPKNEIEGDYSIGKWEAQAAFSVFNMLINFKGTEQE